MASVQEIINGFGPNFPGVKKLYKLSPTPAQVESLSAPIPSLGRYSRSVDFMKGVTSQRQVSLTRFSVMIEYFIALNEFMAVNLPTLEGTIFTNLSDEQKSTLRTIGTTDSEIVQAELIEQFTDHDTAAAGDYLKLRIATLLPELEPNIEGIHFACTSEDVMSNVFGVMGNTLVYTHFLKALIDVSNTFIVRAFCPGINLTKKEIKKREKKLGRKLTYSESTKPQVMPALTHKQPAEITTLGKKFMPQLHAIINHIKALESVSKQPLRFTGKLGGAIGTLATHNAAYPDLPWEDFARGFIMGLGLTYEEVTHQSVSYATEARILTAVANTLTPIIKMVNDFIDMASAPTQFFIKKKKPGQKGSSIMPNKSNAWAMEGAIPMLEKASVMLRFTADKLQSYPHEGNMARSFLMRDIGSEFMLIFIAFDRIQKELPSYIPNPAKIQSFIHEYPGMSGSIIQTILKREGIEGDAYRLIQEISINQDGTYANADQFKTGLARVMQKLNLSQKVQKEILEKIEPSHQASQIHNQSKQQSEEVSAALQIWSIISKI